MTPFKNNVSTTKKGKKLCDFSIKYMTKKNQTKNIKQLHTQARATRREKNMFNAHVRAEAFYAKSAGV